MPFDHVLTSDDLRNLYRAPSPLVMAKSRPTIDAATQDFLGRCTFAVVGTSGLDGTLDTSPRGGDPGFIQVVDPTRLAIADLNGNNRLDSIRNVIESGRIALLCIVPGRSETVRINGSACVTTDPAVLSSFPATFRTPKSAIGVDVDEVFVHCAKAFTRGKMWEPEAWTANVDTPDIVTILACQNVLSGDLDGFRAGLADGYAQELAQDRDDSPTGG